MFLGTKHFKLLILFALIILNNCQLQDPSLNHGIVFLENRSKKLVINTSNKNDVLKIIGHPHSKSINNENEWFYVERVLTKGQYHKLGQNILKANNVLVLKFDKYGILKNKDFYDKNSKNKLKFSEKETTNEITQKSFVEKFLTSIREKMYGNK